MLKAHALICGIIVDKCSVYFIINQKHPVFIDFSKNVIFGRLFRTKNTTLDISLNAYLLM